MGVVIKAKGCNIKIETTFSDFNKMRIEISKFFTYDYKNFIERQLKISEHASQPEAIKLEVEAINTLDKELKQELDPVLYSFLIQSDDDGSLSAKECKELLHIIEPLKIDDPLTVVGFENRYEQLKKLLKYCSENKTRLQWS